MIVGFTIIAWAYDKAVEIGPLDKSLQREREIWREKLAEAEHRYTETKNEESLAEFKHALKVFADLVLRNKMPS
jgi:hypothetical protein